MVNIEKFKCEANLSKHFEMNRFLLFAINDEFTDSLDKRRRDNIPFPSAKRETAIVFEVKSINRFNIPVLVLLYNIFVKPLRPLLELLLITFVRGTKAK